MVVSPGIQRSLFVSLVIAATELLAPSARAQSHFEEVPGVREFSGQMIARPLDHDVARPRANREIDAWRRRLEAFELVRYVPQTDEYIFRVPAGRNENEIADWLLATGDFRYVEPDWRVFPIGCPNDADLASQWHHNVDRMDSCAGWDLHTGNATVVVGYCDTGILTTHEDLLLHRQEGYNAVDQLWESAGGDISPIHPHGTWVTGCGSGNGDNGVGIAGVGWNLGHRMLRVSNSSSGNANLSDLQHAAMTSIESGDRVASVSYSGVDSSSNRSTATYIKSIGGLLVWAAGNDGADLDWGDRDDDDIIVAGGTDEGDGLVWFSAFGRSVDVAAPANNIYTTGPGSNNAYDVVSGTSFACPLTAGMCALIWSFQPNLSPDDVESLLKSGCEDLGSAGVDDTFGHGRIDVLGSLSAMGLLFSYPNGQPATVKMTGGTTFDVAVTAAGTSPVAGSGLLHVNDGGGWMTWPMADGAPGSFVARFEGLPFADFGDTISYYVSVAGADGLTYNHPISAPATFFTATADHAGALQTVLVDLDFETAVGWTVQDTNVTDGTWDVGLPLGGGDREDPPADFDGSGQCWLTDRADGNTDVDGGPTRLLSPVYDVTGFQEVVVNYARWFGSDDSDDLLDVEVSPDGGVTWTLLESVAPQGGWIEVSHSIGDVIALTSQFQIRFSATDNPNDSVTESGIDAFQLVGTFCPLKLDISPETAALNDPFYVTTWEGTPGTLTATFVSDISGTPTFVRVDVGLMDAEGRHMISGLIPNDPTLSGLDLDLIGFGFEIGGKLVATNIEPLSIQ